MGIKSSYLKKLDLTEQIQKLTAETLNQNKKLNKAKDIGNIFNTDAGQMALEMDKADGKADGKISASVWNNYAAGHEGRTTISENGSISVFDAMNSITTYTVREQAQENGPDTKPTEKEDPNIDYD